MRDSTFVNNIHTAEPLRQWWLQDIFSGGLSLYRQLFQGAKKPKISISAVF